ncbi:MAG: 30S ribosomal protein S13 [Chlamydiae bacterium]|nr:30S ribosomal protein S13 [Chlamydiota bacterium]
MVRILGVDIPDNKRVEISLTYIFGVGKKRSNDILNELKLDRNMRAHRLKAEDVSNITTLLQKQYVVEGDLRRQIQNNIKRLVNIQCYRGVRHRSGLPVRGQRTSTNARTRKGKKRTVAGKKRAPGPK